MFADVFLLAVMVDVRDPCGSCWLMSQVMAVPDETSMRCAGDVVTALSVPRRVGAALFSCSLPVGLWQFLRKVAGAAEVRNSWHERCVRVALNVAARSALSVLQLFLCLGAESASGKVRCWTAWHLCQPISTILFWL